MSNPSSIEQDFSYEPVLLNARPSSRSYQPTPSNALEFLQSLPKGKLHHAVQSINNGEFKPEQEFTIEDKRNRRAIILTARELQILVRRLDEEEEEDRLSENDHYYSEIRQNSTAAEILSSPSEQALPQNQAHSFTPSVNPKLNQFLFTIALTVSLSGFLYGYQICLTVTGDITGKDNIIDGMSGLSWPSLPFNTGLVLGFGAVSALGAGIVTNYFGPKRTLMISDGLFMLSATLVISSGNGFDEGLVNFEAVITGLAIGLAVYSAPLYLSDCAPANMRDAMLITFDWMLIFAFLFANIFSAFADTFETSFAYDAFYGLPSFLQFICLFFLPETPRWLIEKRREREAKEVFKRIYDRRSDWVSFANDQLALVVNSENPTSRASSIFGVFPLVRMMNVTHVKKSLIVGCLLQGMQQLIGVNTIMYFARKFVYDAKIASVNNRNDEIQNYVLCICLVITGCTIAGSISLAFLTSRMGRRKLLLFSIISVIAGVLILGVGFVVLDAVQEIQYNNCTRDGYVIKDNNTLNSCVSSAIVWTKDYHPFYSYAPMIGLTIFISSVSAGLGPLPRLINLEIYPHWARSTALSLSCFCHFIGFIVIFYTFTMLQIYFNANSLNIVICCILVIIGLFALILFYFILPETKGLPMQEIERLFMSSEQHGRQTSNIELNELDTVGVE